MTTKPDPLRDGGAPDAAPLGPAANDPSPAGAPAASREPGSEGDRLALLEAEKLDLHDKLLRSLAEIENLRRRNARELADARSYAATNFARDMLTVADNLRRALDSVPEAARSELQGVAKPLFEGVELTERDLLRTFERHGVKRLEPLGQKFDPNLHQAMYEVPGSDAPNGTVVQVLQTGFVIGERVLRPALVAVAKGGPRPAAAPAEPAASEEEDDGA